MSTDVFGGSGTIIAFLGGIAVLAGYIWQLLRGLNNRNEARDQKKAEELKRATEDIAIRLKQTAEDRAAELKKATEELATNIKREADARDVVSRTYTDQVMAAFRLQVVAIDEKLEGLTDRSDLVNGNIANIRGDLVDISDDIDDLYKKIGEDSPDRVREKFMTYKKRRIEADRIAQSPEERPHKIQEIKTNRRIRRNRERERGSRIE